MFNRRRFLKAAGALSVAAGIAAPKLISQAATNPTGVNGRRGQGTFDWQTQDKEHEEIVKYFLANIGKDPNFWPKPLEFKMDGDVKVFELTTTEGPFEVAPGMTVNAMFYNGQQPAPLIRVTQGDKVRVILNNKMSQSTAIHFHGVHTPNAMDGVPYVTQPPVTPGSSFVYEFTAKNPGTQMYHTHHNSAEQESAGLQGPFIIDPIDPTQKVEVSADYIIILNDSGLGLTLNARSFPATQPILAKKGDKILVRFLNEGQMIHPMHLHGMPQTVIAKDGFNLNAPQKMDTVTVAPGERWDVLIDCQEPGAWAYHCHILSHAEGTHGMFGMVTALVIQ
jgi:FtsP/CotA-like multicopper oxidase with cupredoxin domain